MANLASQFVGLYVMLRSGCRLPLMMATSRAGQTVRDNLAMWLVPGRLSRNTVHDEAARSLRCAFGNRTLRDRLFCYPSRCESQVPGLHTGLRHACESGAASRA